MPGRPRVANSIATAREARGTPASMKTFLEGGDKLQQGKLKKNDQGKDEGAGENGGGGVGKRRGRPRKSKQ